MSTTYHYETTPAHLDDEGNFVPEMQHRMYGSDNPYARAAHNLTELQEDHGYMHPPANPLEDKNPGPHMTLHERDLLLTEAFTAAALAKKAQGRARNVYNRRQIASNIGTETSEVNGHGRAMLPEHMRRLNAAILGLVGDLSTVPHDPTDNKRTANDFIRTYYGDAAGSQKNRASMKRAIAKRQKAR